jgi:leucyl aminopeptidase
MQWTVATTLCHETVGDLIVLPVFQKKEKANLIKAFAPIGGDKGLIKTIEAAGFDASAESLLPVPVAGAKAQWMLLVGLGEEGELGLDQLRKAAGKCAGRARDMKTDRVLVAVTDPRDQGFDDVTFGRCWTEGAEMALSPTGELKTNKKKAQAPRSWKLLAHPSRAADLRKGVKEGQGLAAGCLFARALVNEPPNILTPNALAARARAMARKEGLTCKVHNVAALKKMNAGGILGVGQGSKNPPCLIEVAYKAPGRSSGKSKRKHVVLVGKGVTFDTGGISLKPGPGMEEMKADMGGAAAVLGAGLIAARLKLPIDVTVLVPAAENMPDGNAVRPADVITMASGKTVEILNTDAEGRLILADALWYGGKKKPDYIMDAATLTGACVVALGKHFAGMMGNSGELMDLIQQAGGETHERVWPLPLIDEHKDIMKGTWSDLKNLGGGRWGGALTAAAFLSAFVEDDMPWVHLDIAGPAYVDSASATCPKGGSGFGARLIARTLQILAD